MKPSQKTVGIALITYNARHHLPLCLPPLLHSRIVVVNSSSNDGTVEYAKEMGVEILVVPRQEFNHGLTREKARQYLGTDIVVMMTPDAYLKDPAMLDKLIDPIREGKAAVSYARQIPHKGSGFFESFPREFNYPDKSHIRGIADVNRYGVYTFFCSDACAAWSQAALDEIGGFESVLVGEDTVAASKLIHRGHKIAYVAEAQVYHSHCYGLMDEFRRHFDTGLARKEYEHLLRGGTDHKRGQDYVKKMCVKLFKTKPYLLPYSFCHIAAKLFGYQIGKMSQKAPVWLKRALSGQDFYWENT